MVSRFISGLSGLNILKSVDYFSDHDGTCSTEHCTEDSYIMKKSKKNLKDSKKNHKR